MRTFLLETVVWRGRALSGRELFPFSVDGLEGVHGADTAGFSEPLGLDLGSAVAERDEARLVQLEDLGGKPDAVAAADADGAVNEDGQSADPSFLSVGHEPAL